MKSPLIIIEIYLFIYLFVCLFIYLFDITHDIKNKRDVRILEMIEDKKMVNHKYLQS
jgi:hypothetical protein